MFSDHRRNFRVSYATIVNIQSLNDLRQITAKKQTFFKCLVSHSLPYFELIFTKLLCTSSTIINEYLQSCLPLEHRRTIHGSSQLSPSIKEKTVRIWPSILARGCIWIRISHALSSFKFHDLCEMRNLISKFPTQ